MVPNLLEDQERADIIMQENQAEVTGGVDTHKQVHVAAVVNPLGVVLGTSSFPVTTTGYQTLLSWMESFGRVVRVGVEGTGSYGAGLNRYLTAKGVTVIEVNRPNRQTRRRYGKSDTVDAQAAARAALNRDATGTPKTGTGTVEGLRALRIARQSAVKAATQVTNQIRDLIVTAPDELRSKLIDLETDERIKVCAQFRINDTHTVLNATKRALRSLARRYNHLAEEISELDHANHSAVISLNPALLGAHGVGPDVAAALLIAAGDNPHRMRNEASFAALCGTSPIEASSGKIVRHRLNRGGNRDANNAMWRIVITRKRHDPKTRAYVARRQTEKKTDREIVRCLKRYVIREIFRLLTNPPTIPTGNELRTLRTAKGYTLTAAAKQLNSYPNRLSDLERDVTHNNQLAIKYHHWLTTQTAA